MLSDMETQGGAAVAASRLASGLCLSGHEVTRVVCWPDGSTHLWQTERIVSGSDDSIRSRLVQRFAPKTARTGIETQVERAVLDLIDRVRPDLINVHNLHGARGPGWSLRVVKVAAERAPTLWTLHDMWSFTGRCAYTGACRKFETGCDAACPTPKEYPELEPEAIAEEWNTRRLLFEGSKRLAAIAPSQWLAREARAGVWKHSRVEVIPYGLPLDTYQVRERELARAAIGIRQEGLAVLIVADHLGAVRKGGALLVQALAQLKTRPKTLIALGNGDLPSVPPGIEVRRLGFISDDYLKSLVYSAADIYVHAAIEDNLPNTLLESLACGTPAVAFSIGGVPDIVRPGVTGWLAKSTTAEALASTIETALDEIASGTQLGEGCRKVAESEYSLELQGQRYADLVRTLR